MGLSKTFGGSQSKRRRTGPKKVTQYRSRLQRTLRPDSNSQRRITRSRKVVKLRKILLTQNVRERRMKPIQQTCLFLKLLPAEMRIKIYDHLFSGSWIDIGGSEGRYNSGNSDGLDGGPDSMVLCSDCPPNTCMLRQTPLGKTRCMKVRGTNLSVNNLLAITATCHQVRKETAPLIGPAVTIIGHGCDPLKYLCHLPDHLVNNVSKMVHVFWRARRRGEADMKEVDYGKFPQLRMLLLYPVVRGEYTERELLNLDVLERLEPHALGGLSIFRSRSSPKPILPLSLGSLGHPLVLGLYSAAICVGKEFQSVNTNINVLVRQEVALENPSEVNREFIRTVREEVCYSN